MFKSRNPLKFILDRLSYPLLVFLSIDSSHKLGLTPIDEERIYACLKHSVGKTLDIGCGDGRFIQAYGNGYGIDKFFINMPRFVLGDATKIPFKDNTFDTVTFIASLNHIVNRKSALIEAARVLKDNGRILITMINPFIGFMAHKVIRKRYDPDQIKRHIEKGELFGLTKSQINILASCTNLRIVSTKSVLLFGNKLYMYKKNV